MRNTLLAQAAARRLGRAAAVADPAMPSELRTRRGAWSVLGCWRRSRPGTLWPGSADATVPRNTISGTLDGSQIDGRRVLLCGRGNVPLTPSKVVR